VSCGMARAVGLLAVVIAAALVSAACGGAEKLFGVAPVYQCLQGYGADVTYFGKGSLLVHSGGPGAKRASGSINIFRSELGARRLSARRRRTFRSNPVWTIRNVSLLGLGPGIHRVVARCLGEKQETEPARVMLGAPSATPVVFGVPAKVLPATAVAHGWKIIAERSAKKTLQFDIDMQTRRFRAFAVSVEAPALMQVQVVAAVTCAMKDGGAGSHPVRFSGGAPVVLELRSDGCTHDIPPNVFVRAKLDQPGGVTVRVLMR
jgi:hypothetical protein